MKRGFPFGLNVIWCIKNVQYLYCGNLQVINLLVFHVSLYGTVKFLNK